MGLGVSQADLYQLFHLFNKDGFPAVHAPLSGDAPEIGEKYHLLGAVS